jgi:hypothetical protein
VSQVSSTPVDARGLTWMFSHVAPMGRTVVDARQRLKSTSQAEYAGSIPVIGSMLRLSDARFGDMCLLPSRAGELSQSEAKVELRAPYVGCYANRLRAGRGTKGE